MALGAQLEYHDPYVDNWSVDGSTRVDDMLAGAAEADLTVLLQNHSSFDIAAIERTAKRLFDTRGVTSGEGGHRL